MKHLKALCFVTLLALGTLSSCTESTSKQPITAPASIVEPLTSSEHEEISKTWSTPNGEKPLLTREYNTRSSYVTNRTQKH